MPSSPRAPRPPESPARRTLRVMLMQVFGLHLVAIAVHELADVGLRTSRVRMTYLAVWIALTVAIVALGLHRTRLARNAARRPPPPARS